jgi:hypothetical protein
MDNESESKGRYIKRRAVMGVVSLGCSVTVVSVRYVYR